MDLKINSTVILEKKMKLRSGRIIGDDYEPDSIYISGAGTSEINGKYIKNVFQYCCSPYYTHCNNDNVNLFYLCGWVISNKEGFIYQMKHENPNEIIKTKLPSKNQKEWSVNIYEQSAMSPTPQLFY